MLGATGGGAGEVFLLGAVDDDAEVGGMAGTGRGW